MFEKNLEVLKKKDKILYEKVITHKLSDKYKIVSSKNGMPNLLISEGKYIHSKYDPEIESQKWVNGINTEEDSILIVGIGLGYYLPKIFSKYPEKIIFVIEPDIEIFIYALKIQDLTKEIKNKKLILLIDLDKGAISAILREYLYYDAVKNFYFAQLPYYQSFKREYSKEIYDNIYKNIYELRSYISTKLYFANMWLDNTIRNLKYIKGDLNSINLKGIASEIPVIIVSAGPSLEKNIDLLKGLNNKAIIIAVGSAVNILENKAIAPHFVMGIDGSETESKIFNSMKNMDPIFVYAPTVHYRSTEKYNGRRSWFALNVQEYISPILDEYFEEYQTIISGPSVANIALDFSNRVLNSKQIIFIGQDLAYTNNKIYAEGNVHQDLEKQKRDYSNEAYVLTKDINGNEIYTKKTFLSMKNWFENYISSLKIQGKVYNCTEGGLNINGMINMKFEQAIEEFCTNKYMIDELINDTYDKNIKKIINTEKYSSFLNKLGKETEKLMELSKKRIELLSEIIEDILKKQDNINFNKRFEEIINIGKKIEKKLTYQYFIYPLLKIYLDITTFGANRELQKEKKEKIEGLKTLLNQYVVIDNSIKVAKRAFENN